MRNFTYSNYLSKAPGYDRFLTKGLLLFMALVLFQFTQVLAQEATEAEQATETSQPSSSTHEGDCNNFHTFYANHGSGITGTDLYGVTYSGSDAILEFIANVGFQTHIAYNAEDNVLYLVNANGSEVVILDQDGANPPFAIAIQGSINQVYAVVYNPADGLLYVGDANDDEIFTLDPLTGELVLFSEGSSVDGGDLALQNDKLYLADRSGRDLYEVVAGANNDVLVGDLPSNVNGMAQANNANGLVVSRGNTDEFVEVDAADGTTIQTYTAILDGESFTLLNGDMAAGCSEDENVEIPCEGPWRTQTQGGWGSPGNGNNPGVYRDANFDAAFPGGLSIGCNDGFSLTLSSASAVQSFLPSGGAPSALDENLDDPTGNEGWFAGNLTALALSLGFDAYDEDFGVSEFPLSDLYIQEGDFSGMTVGELFAVANDVIGGCNENYAPPEVNDAIDAVNNAFVDGEDQGSNFLGCSEPGFEEDLCEDSGECYGVTVDYVQGTAQGGGAIAAERANPMNALVIPEGTDALVFTALGYGGSLTFQFDGVVTNGPGDDIEVVETSFGNPGCEAFPEYVDVSVSVDGVSFYFIGTVCKSDPFVDISDADVDVELGCVSYVRVANNDEMTSTPDGFDVYGIVALHNCEDNGNDEGPALTGVEANNALTSFPNPTSGLSEAVFITAETERATLEVYNMNGRVVETLFNQVANANQEYRVDFDGMKLPNGVYVYRLTTDSDVTVEKFMITR